MDVIVLHTHRKEFKAHDGNDSGQEADDHGANRCEHHFTSRSHRYPTGQGRILDVYLRENPTQIF